MFAKFRKNQFGENATSMQLVFDLIFGIVMPLLCFYLDPIVYQENGYGSPLFPNDKAFAYSFSFASIAVFAVWLCFGKRFKWLNAVCAGLFFTGAAFCLVMGLVLLPFSLIGLIFLIGFFGLTPFFTGFVYLRNGLRAWHLVKGELAFRHLANTVALTAILSFVFPAILNSKINQAISDLINGDPQTIETSTQRLKYVPFFIDSDKVVRAYGATGDREKQAALAAAYKQLFGEDIERKHRRIID